MLDGGIGGVGDAAGRAGAVEVHVPLVIGSTAFPQGSMAGSDPQGWGYALFHDSAPAAGRGRND